MNSHSYLFHTWFVNRVSVPQPVWAVELRVLSGSVACPGCVYELCVPADGLTAPSAFPGHRY